ncbi:hypothetical protein [Acidovorax sp.]|uniref:hypothetical protein n=1 Tax=Acidovorax sp. TaxID=1872122 RepID=UPI00391F72D3
MTATTTTSIPGAVRLDKLFYIPATATLHARSIDQVVQLPDGRQVGSFSGETQAEIAARYGEEVLISDIQAFHEMQEASMITAPEPSTERDFTAALECLPPMRWGHHGGVESFRCSEFYSGHVTRIYANLNGTYWTWKDNAFISADALNAKVRAAAAAASAGSAPTAAH